MESGERKNIQARQSSDGTFELFVGQGGLEEISEEEVSVAEIVAPSSLPTGKEERSKTVPIVIASVLILAVALGGFLLLKGDKKGTKESALTEVQGFRAYRGNVPTPKKQNTAQNLEKKSVPKLAEAKEKVEEESDTPESEEDNVAWKLTGKKEPTPANNVEARIQPNRNPSPESYDIVIHDEDNEDVIDDENDDSNEIAAQKRLGFLPVTPDINKKALKNIETIKPNRLIRDMPKFKGIPKIPPTSKSTADEN